jgi:hypothetical protein
MFIIYKHTDFEIKVKKKMNPLKFFSGVTGGKSPGRLNTDLWQGYEAFGNPPAWPLATV